VLGLARPAGEWGAKKSASDDAQHRTLPIAQSHSQVREQSKRMTDRRPLPGRSAAPLVRLVFVRFIYGPTRGSLVHRVVFNPELFPSPSLLTSFDPSSLVALRLRVDSARFAPLQSSFASTPRSVHLSVRASPRLGSCPLRDFTRPQLRFMRRLLVSLASCRPRIFSIPRRFLPRSGSQAYFIPLPRPGSRSFRGFSRRAATLPLREEPAPLPLARRLLTRLRGLPSPACLDFEAFFRTGPRSSRVRYSHTRASLPSSSFSPSGPHFPR
jgi:hypothetical protein